MDRKKEARGRLLRGKGSGGKSWIQRNQRKLAEQNKLRPGYLHYQKSNQTQRRQEKLEANQDKIKLSHSNDWCAKTGSNTTPPEKLIPL